MRIFKTIVLFIFFAVLVIYMLQNMEPIQLKFIKWHLEMPLSFASLFLYILGAISGGLIFSMLKKLSSNDSKEEA